MGKENKFRDLIGAIKDKASVSKAAIFSDPKTLSLQLSILKATTHDPTNPPQGKHLSKLLSFTKASRATTSAVMDTLMNRLHRTRNAYVSLKCLITIHYIIKYGTFIFQDQLSIYPHSGGRNHLNLSKFRDSTSPDTWVLSSWVRWYASYLEQLLSTSRVLGFFLCCSSCSLEKDKSEEKLTSLVHKDLLRETESLVSLIKEASRAPDCLQGNKLNTEIMVLIGDDFLSFVNEVSLRLAEIKERKLSSLRFGESVELGFALKRLEECKGRLTALFNLKNVSVDLFWCFVEEMKDEVETMKKKGCKEEEKLLRIGWTIKATESARFGDRVLVRDNSVHFSSERFLH